MASEKDLLISSAEEGDDEKVVYEKPKIISYSEKEIADRVGPAQACSPMPCTVTP